MQFKEKAINLSFNPEREEQEIPKVDKNLKRGSLMSQNTNSTTPSMKIANSKFAQRDLSSIAEDLNASNGLKNFKNDINFSSTTNIRNLSTPFNMKSLSPLEEARDSQLQILSETLKGIQKFKTEQVSPDLLNNTKKKQKPKIINIKSLKKVELEGSEVFHNTLKIHECKYIMDEFDKLVEKEVPEYRKIPLDRITPNLLLKFSKAFEQIISHSNSYNSADCPVGDSQPHKNTETVFYYIKQAYESFIKRIIGISDLSETEQVLKKCLELSSSKFSANPAKEDPDNTKNKRFVKSYSVLIDEHKELLESNAELAKDFKNTKLKMENDLKEYSKRKAEQLKKMKAIIRQLKLKLEDVSKTEISVSKYIIINAIEI